MSTAKARQPFSWTVLHYDCNRNLICPYDVLKYREDEIKKFKKKCDTKEQFADMLKSEMMYRFWSKAEWELVIRINDENKIELLPWCGCHAPEAAKIEVVSDCDFNWNLFAKERNLNRGDEAKIDVWDQLKFRFEEFVDYCWNYRHKWQRSGKPSENQQKVD